MARTGRTAWFLPLFALFAALAGCRTVPQPATSDPAAVGTARFPGADAILSGFDPAETGVEWRVGDRVLYALSTGSGTRARTKLVEIELLGASSLQGANPDSRVQIYESIGMQATLAGRKVEWSSPVLRVAVQVFEADGRLQQRTEVKVPETVLRSGLHPAFELISELQARSELAGDAKPVELSDSDARVVGEALTMLPTLLGILQDDGVLQSLLMQVIGPPPLLSILRGVQVNVNCDFERASVVPDRVAFPFTPGTLHRLPLRLDVNDSPTLDLELTVAAADPPLRICGGLVSLTGSARRDPARTVSFELLAARRGPPGAEIRP